LLPLGFDFAVLNERNIVGGGCRNVLCPICGSHDRERLIYLYLLHKTNIFKQATKLLHVAPEQSLKDIFHKKPNIDYLTADLFAENVMVKMDVTNICFPDNSFDAIICNHVLEHIVDDRKAISELYRTLKPGGWAILQVPISLSLEDTYEDWSVTTASGREKVFGQADHVRIYAKDYKDRLEQGGFKIEIFEWSSEAEDYGGQENRFGLNRDESVYVAIKDE
jgi:predicted SAM-dependent methyltransferase